jgi:hypothetical protein
MDAITSTGFIEGWAFDDNDPMRHLIVSVCALGEEVARGLANRYRWDLVDAGCGIGWCAFRLRVIGPECVLHEHALSLCEVSSQIEICRTATLPLISDTEAELSTMEDVLNADPTLLHDVKHLRGCSQAFSSFLDAEGTDGFVRTAYVYMLARPADAEGLALYARLLKNSAITPYGLLEILHDTEEFRSASRLLQAPSEPGFAFRRP